MKNITTFLLTFTVVFLCQTNLLNAQLPEGSFLLVSDITANVTPTSDYKILKFDNNGQNGVIFTEEELSWPQDILIADIPNEGHRVLISNLFSGKITKYDLNGNYLGDFATGLGSPTRMRIVNDVLFVLQWNDLSGPEFILRFALDGTALDNYTDTGIPLSIGMDWDQDGNFYVSSYGQPPFGGNPAIPAQVHMFNSNGQYQGVFISESELAGPTNIWFDKSGNGNLWVIDYNGSSLKLFDNEGNNISTVVTNLNRPEGVVFLDNGNFLMGNGLTGLIKMYDMNGTFIEDFVDSNASMDANLINTNAFYIVPSTLSLPEVDQKHSAFLHPSIGHQFTFDSQLVNLKDTIHVYSTLGKKIDTLELDQSFKWSPQHYDNGIYFIEVISKDEQRKTQKIIIKN